MNNSNLYTSSVKSQIDPNYQVQYEKNLTGSQRPTYGFQFISDFNPGKLYSFKKTLYIIMR